MGVTRRRAHEEPRDWDVSLPEKLQLPLVDGRCPDFQHRHLDAARRAGLACPDATYPSRCVGAGYCQGLQFAPLLLLLPWTGSAADRLNQRKLLMFTQAAMGVLALILGVLTIAGVVQLWHVYVLAFLSGSALALDAPVRQAFVAEMVGDEDLPNAVALNSMSFNSAQMIGPAVAGLLIAGAGIGWAFLLNGLSFAAVLISMSFFCRSELRANARAHRASGGFIEGLRYVWKRPDLGANLVMLFLIGTFGFNFPIFISTVAVNVFHTELSTEEIRTLVSGALTDIPTLLAKSPQLAKAKLSQHLDKVRMLPQPDGAYVAEGEWDLLGNRGPVMVAGACNVSNLLVIPFERSLARSVAPRRLLTGWSQEHSINFGCQNLQQPARTCATPMPAHPRTAFIG